MSIVYTSASEVAEEIRQRMEQVTKVNGYETDVGRQVFDGKIKIDDEQVPCSSLIEGNDQVATAPSAKFSGAHLFQQYALVGYERCDPDRPNDTARKIIADLKRSVFGTDGKADLTWGGKVRAVRYRGRNIGPRADGVSMVMAIVEIEVEFVERLV